ncbi:hypothetical protein BKA83DRAFT_1102051 [Pisolithus microcarpus]|nr:hypothetical protein BKA83DRAFT_1102051 [Pisolithus microcarpus]
MHFQVSSAIVISIVTVELWASCAFVAKEGLTWTRRAPRALVTAQFHVAECPSFCLRKSFKRLPSDVINLAWS